MEDYIKNFVRHDAVEEEFDNNTDTVEESENESNNDEILFW